MNDRFEDTTSWSTHKPAWSPLLVLGGSVMAAVMLIGGGLSVLGTESPDVSPAARAALVTTSAAAATTLSAAADLKAIDDPGLDKRR